MSVGKLLVECRNKLRTTLAPSFGNLNPVEYVRVMPAGQPPAIAGELFVGLFVSGVSNPSPEDDSLLKDTVSVHAVISIRSRNLPEDRDGHELFTRSSTSLYDIADKIMLSLHLNTTLARAAGRTEPLRWISTSEPVPQSPSWWRSNDPFDANAQPAGWSMEVIFDGALRVQKLVC